MLPEAKWLILFRICCQNRCLKKVDILRIQHLAGCFFKKWVLYNVSNCVIEIAARQAWSIIAMRERQEVIKRQMQLQSLWLITVY